MHKTLFINHHIVTQIVKAELVVRCVYNIAVVGFALLLGRHVLQSETNRKTQEAIEYSHPFAVTLSQIIVYRDDMYAFARYSIEAYGKRSYESFTFARFHFCYIAVMQHDTADYLNFKVLHPQDAPARLSDLSEYLRQEIVQSFSLFVSFSVLVRFRHELFICQLRESRFEFFYQLSLLSSFF